MGGVLESNQGFFTPPAASIDSMTRPFFNYAPTWVDGLGAWFLLLGCKRSGVGHPPPPYPLPRAAFVAQWNSNIKWLRVTRYVDWTDSPDPKFHLPPKPKEKRHFRSPKSKFPLADPSVRSWKKFYSHQRLQPLTSGGSNLPPVQSQVAKLIQCSSNLATFSKTVAHLLLL